MTPRKQRAGGVPRDVRRGPRQVAARDRQPYRDLGARAVREHVVRAVDHDPGTRAGGHDLRHRHRPRLAVDVHDVRPQRPDETREARVVPPQRAAPQHVHRAQYVSRGPVRHGRRRRVRLDLRRLQRTGDVQVDPRPRAGTPHREQLGREVLRDDEDPHLAILSR
jgi:hypothetical protein